ncbi:hypothetical protein LBMAG42_55920 [Deltaproteobacteria bacterium]|nr:hypothetical protein LBMAG42_55920 [Deltaproteobacteria bacterium]
MGAAPWLRRAVAALAAQEASLPNAASAGLLALLWPPPGGPPLATEALPRERVRSWILAATAEQRADLEHHAVSRAWSTAERIRELDSNPDSGPAEVAAIIEQRDDLQSVLRVLRLSGRGDELTHALRGLDATAQERFASLANVLPALSEDPQEARWMAVAWQEPGAWWTGAV